MSLVTFLTLALFLGPERAATREDPFLDAAQRAERAARDHADDPQAWIALARLHLDPDWLYRRPARAESATRRALKLVGRRPDVVALLARALYDEGRHADALPLVAEVADDAPPGAVDPQLRAELFVMRAEILLRDGPADPDRRAHALADLGRAIDLHPASLRARLVRGEALLADGRFDEARLDLQTAVELRPGSRQAHYELFTCERKLGRNDDALLHYEIWRRLNRLSDSVSLQNAPDAAESRDLLRELKELNPADLDHRLELAQRELELGEADSAIRECDELLALGAPLPRARSLRAEALRARDERAIVPRSDPGGAHGGAGASA